MTVVPLPSRAARATIVTLLVVVLTACLGVVVFGAVDLVTQLAQGATIIAVDLRPDTWGFTFLGLDGVMTEGYETTSTLAVTGLTTATVALGTTARALALLTWLVLGLAALALLRGIRTHRPFGRAVLARVTIAGVALLTLGVAVQLMNWWATNAALREFGVENNEWVHSTDLAFEPLPIAIGLTLLLAAVAFRVGERLQRDAEGLV